MTVTAKALANAQAVPATDTLLYTAPASTKTIIDKMTATNTDASARTLTVYIVPSGQSVGGTYKIYDALSIAANTMSDLSGMQNQILNAGDTIYAKASVASVVIARISGREVA